MWLKKEEVIFPSAGLGLLNFDKTSFQNIVVIFVYLNTIYTMYMYNYTYL